VTTDSSGVGIRLHGSELYQLRTLAIVPAEASSEGGFYVPLPTDQAEGWTLFTLAQTAVATVAMKRVERGAPPLQPFSVSEARAVLAFNRRTYETNPQLRELYDRVWASADGAIKADAARAERHPPSADSGAAARTASPRRASINLGRPHGDGVFKNTKRVDPYAYIPMGKHLEQLVFQLETTLASMASRLDVIERTVQNDARAADIPAPQTDLSVFSELVAWAATQLQAESEM
jgi:hypothetical protein